MSTIPFVVAFICVALVIFWYVQDEATRGGTGESGLLGMGRRPDQRQPDEHDWKPDHNRRPWRVTRR